mmetsp:Transcript_22899/g.50066  ORF Transcript_22899/g.50066 Transcript_22899/m.50066 type:complete len:209 (+) Transcript_22899:1998-2624(+)
MESILREGAACSAVRRTCIRSGKQSSFCWGYRPLCLLLHLGRRTPLVFMIIFYGCVSLMPMDMCSQDNERRLSSAWIACAPRPQQLRGLAETKRRCHHLVTFASCAGGLPRASPAHVNILSQGLFEVCVVCAPSFQSTLFPLHRVRLWFLICLPSWVPPLPLTKSQHTYHYACADTSLFRKERRNASQLGGRKHQHMPRLAFTFWKGQ